MRRRLSAAPGLQCAIGCEPTRAQHFEHSYFTDMCSGSEARSYSRLIDFCITQQSSKAEEVPVDALVEMRMAAAREASTPPVGSTTYTLHTTPYTTHPTPYTLIHPQVPVNNLSHLRGLVVGDMITNKKKQSQWTRWWR